MQKVGAGKMLFTLLWVGIILYATSNFYLSHKAEKRYQTAKERLESLGVSDLQEIIEKKESAVSDEENFWKHPDVLSHLNFKDYPKRFSELEVKEWQKVRSEKVELPIVRFKLGERSVS